MKMPFPRTLIAGLALGTAISVGAQPAFPDPQKAITIVMPYAAGGPNDALGRNLASNMSRFLGAPIIILNVPGAGGTIGFKRAAAAKPDGYTWLIANVGISAAAAIYGKPDLDPRASLISIGMIASTPITINVRKQFPAENLQQFIAYAKKIRLK